MAKRRKIQFSYPKAIAVVTVFSAIIIAKFQSPARRPHLHKKQVSAHRTVSRKQENLLSNRSRLEGSIEQSLTGSQATQSEPQTNQDVAPPQKENLEASKKSCFLNLERLAPKHLPQANLHLDPQKLDKIKRAQQHRRAVARKIQQARRKYLEAQAKLLEEKMDTGLATVDLNSQDALDIPTPLDELAQISFNELPLEEWVHVDRLVAAIQWGPMFTGEFPFEPEVEMQVRESVFQKNEFEDLKQALAELNSKEESTLADLKAPKSKVAWRDLNPEELNFNQDSIPQPESDVIAENTHETQVISDMTVEKSSSSEEPQSTQESQVLPRISAEEETESSSDEESVVKESQPGLAPSLSPTLGAVSTGGIPQLLAKVFVPSNKTSMTTQEASSKSSTQTSSVNSQNSSRETVRRQAVSQTKSDESNSEEDESQVEGKVFGELSVDDSSNSWIRAHKGHIELYLHREGSSDPQDSIFLLDYQFPKSGPQFEIEATGLKGKYKLIAGVYIPESSVPVAQIPYSKTISADSWKEKVFLVINREVFKPSSQSEEASQIQDFVPLNLTLFEGAPGNYRSPKAIPNAEVTLVGFPELGAFISDKEGNIRIPKVPVASEIVIEAKASGHYPTRQIVPIFSSLAYAPIYLIEKSKVEVVTNLFTKKPQQGEKGLVMGRVYDIKTRSPLAGESLSLSHRRGNPVYFGALPDLTVNATLSTGLFAFYNIEPSIRALGRSSEKYPLIFNVAPGYGYYLELGRGGSRNLLGRLIDPFAGRDVFGSIQVVGSSQESQPTSETGKFKIENLDLPPGVITLESFAEGYPRTWYTLPWTTREAEKEKTLYMIERDLIKESAARVARVKHEKNTGVILGGANSTLFKRGRQRIQLQLLDTQGNSVAEEHGPFSLSHIPKTKGPFTLSPADPGFTFYNLQPGEYILNMMDESRKVFRTHVVRVGVERVSVVVN